MDTKEEKKEPEKMDRGVSAILQLIGFTHAEDPTNIKEDLMKQAGERADVTAVALVKKLDVSSLNASIIDVIKTLFTEAELAEAVKIAESPVVKKARIATASINKTVSDVIGAEATRLMSERGDGWSPSREQITKEKPSGLKEGDKVIVGRHSSEGDGEDDNWSPRMDKYVDKVATIKKILGFDPEGYEVARIDLDEQEYSWRTRNMKRAPQGGSSLN